MDADAQPAAEPAGDPPPAIAEPPAPPPAETPAPPPVEPDASRRSDRWEAGAREARNPWAWLAAGFALLGIVAVVIVGMATAERAPFAELPDRAAYVLFAAVPSLGVLALMSGLSGRHGSRARGLAWVGLVVGAVLALGALVVTIVLITALRTLG